MLPLALALVGCSGPSDPEGGEISENRPPTARISSPTSGAVVDRGTTVSFEGSGNDPEDGPLTGGSLVWQSNLDGALGEGASFTRNDLSPGQHTITLVAVDSERARGSATSELTVEATPLADLTAGPIRFDPSDPDASQTVAILASISNRGDAATPGPIPWQMFVGDIEVASGEVPALEVGETSDEVGATAAGPFAPGSHFVSFRVDLGNVIGELNESNNFSTDELSVTRAPGPEFVFETLTREPPSVAEGQPITIVSRVRNSGSIATTVPSDYRILVADQVVATGKVPILEVGERFEIRETVGPFAAGAYAVTVELHINDDVPEGNEDDNAAAIAIAYTGPAFDIDLRFVRPVSPTQAQAFATAANRWREIIIGDVPDEVVSFPGAGNCPDFDGTLDDLLVSADLRRIDGAGGVLGRAGPCLLREESFLPLAGVMEFDIDDLAVFEAEGLLEDLILHEMAHVIGFGTIWRPLDLLVGSCRETGPGCDPQFDGPDAVVAYQSIGGTTPLVPVENQGGGGTSDAHWREAVFDNELMTGFADGGSNPISVVTAAQFADLGYEVNTAPSDPFSLSFRAREKQAHGSGVGLRIRLLDDIYTGPVYIAKRSGAVVPMLAPQR